MPGTGQSLTKNQQYTFDRIVKASDGVGGATKADAAPLVKRGLIESVSGKGRGAGNTPLWKLTEAGRKAAGIVKEASAATPKYAFLGPTSKRRIVGETETSWLLEPSSPKAKPLPVRKDGARTTDED